MPIYKILRSGSHPPLAQPEEEPLFDDGSALCGCSEVAMKTASRKGVTVDRCPSCKAIWSDAGELQQVVEAEGRPGLRPSPAAH